MRAFLWWILQRLLDVFQLTAGGRSDFSNPLPYAPMLKRTQTRWNRPSSLRGISYNLEEMKDRLDGLVSTYGREIDELESYDAIAQRDLGWGYPLLDAVLLYMTIRDLKPKRYVEVGSGMSTFYSKLAFDKNRTEGFDYEMICIEPYPSESVSHLPGIQLIAREVQDVELPIFRSLDANDVLFIDSSHVIKIDGDVPFLYLEVLPLLSRGVYIHCHDIPFPYNTPFPASFWILDNQTPMFWTEPMMLQSFLAFNSDFKISMSLPLLRSCCESFLREKMPMFRSVAEEPNTFSSLWLQRVG